MAVTVCVDIGGLKYGWDRHEWDLELPSITRMPPVFFVCSSEPVSSLAQDRLRD